MTSLLQLFAMLVSFVQMVQCSGSALSARVESARFWESVAVLMFGAISKGEKCEGEDDGANDSSVCFPIRRLRVPSTSW